MPDSPAPAYKVDSLPLVIQQVQTLWDRARRKGALVVCVNALTAIRENLQTNPSAWGDPQYHTIQAGGTVYRGIQPPLLARYVV